ncbi:Nif3-like dinuclear metal center hexameric protein [Jeotgalibacillus aurantiacus]|uniref:Nif3-like dinuclear metal center hexameric protein n=1 Tax=Jeotgalibacillus aurantiacus TaxID=2763266 RepID=UPI001D0AF676|nr:Nif3-like dinuclear metal center hexameric protein [Jeotgalibacillus aurantiacus]
MKLSQLTQALNQEFSIHQYGKDPAFSRFIPQVYSPGWESYFEKEFNELFNGLMIKGAPEVQSVFLAVFPTEEVLERFLQEGQAGDLLFMHHPLVMECGDPLGISGRGFVPISGDYLTEIIRRKLSIYTCHIPMDYHPVLNTSKAIIKALQGTITDGFEPDHFGNHLIHMVEIDPISTAGLIKKLKGIFEIPYVDFEGREIEIITKIAVVAGCGDKVDWIQEAEKRGAQAYISGEIHCHIDNDYGQMKYSQIMHYVKETSMSLIGVSHSASEYLVKKTLMKEWFEQAGVQTKLLPQSRWWV